MISPILNDVVSGRAPELMTFTVDQYHQLTQSGVLPEGSPVELIDGVIVCKDRRDGKGSAMNYGPNHGYSVSKLFEILSGQLQDHACHVRNQIPVTLAENAEPEPDLAVVTGTLENYTGRHPEPSEVVVAIEIADSSLNYDRTTKQRIYAAANIPVYWIVNLTDRCVEVYEQPDESAGKYLSMSTFDETEQVALVMSDASSVGATVADFLPPTTP